MAPTDAPTDRGVREALRAIAEPELDRSIVDLGMVQGVAVDGSTVVIALALPIPDEAIRDQLVPDIREAVRALDGVDRVDVDVRPMREDELPAVARVLKGEPPPTPLRVVDAATAASSPGRGASRGRDFPLRA